MLYWVKSEVQHRENYKFKQRGVHASKVLITFKRRVWTKKPKAHQQEKKLIFLSFSLFSSNVRLGDRRMRNRSNSMAPTKKTQKQKKKKPTRIGQEKEGLLRKEVMGLSIINNYENRRSNTSEPDLRIVIRNWSRPEVDQGRLKFCVITYEKDMHLPDKETQL